jgi:hypothetical protein
MRLRKTLRGLLLLLYVVGVAVGAALLSGAR